MEYQVISQRDNRWKNNKLGNSNLTIGSSGCLITCLAIALGNYPDLVDEKLRQVGGFSGALVIWSKVQKAFPQLKFLRRAYAYDNTTVLNAIKNHGFCLVEATTLLNGKHWLFFIGNHQLIDPWTGTVRSTRSYLRYTGFAVFSKV